jgi:accessory colonization factor AcfC
MWEELAINAGKLSEVQKNIYPITSNSAQAINAWKTDTTIDAWLTYASWYYRLKDIASLVTISPHKNIRRGTPIAITEKTNQKELADRFVRFLSTPEAKRIFIKWGWNKK